jgi:hypothetical protein
MTLKEIKHIWLNHTRSLDDFIDFKAFIEMNKELDELFEEDTSDDDYEEDALVEGKEDVDEEGDARSMDIWDESVDSRRVFPSEFIAYLEIFHGKHANLNNLLSYHSFKEWKDIKDLLAEGNVDISCLKDIWAEALQYKAIKSHDGVNYNGPARASATIGFDFASPRNDQNEEYMIDMDTFIRVNFRLEEVMEDIKKALEALSEKDITAYYTKEFAELTNGEALLSMSQLFDWPVVQEVVESGHVSLQQLEMLWLALPKQPLGSFHRKRTNGKGFASGKIVQSDGITLDAFLSFNNAMEDLVATTAVDE